MHAGRSYTPAKRQAQANADSRQASCWLFMYGGTFWISNTPPKEGNVPATLGTATWAGVISEEIKPTPPKPAKPAATGGRPIDVTPAMRDAVKAHMGYVPPDEVIQQALVRYQQPAEQLQIMLDDKLKALKAAGGGGIELSEAVDGLQIAITIDALRKATLPPMIKVASSNVAAIGYKPGQGAMTGVGELVIQFQNGGAYSYPGVAQADYDALMAADSKGKAFAQIIKGRYSVVNKIQGGIPEKKETADVQR